MANLRHNWVKGIFSSLLMVTFFVSQIFSCCLVNQKLGQYIHTALSAPSHSLTAAHSCCHRASSESVSEAKAPLDAAKHSDCCIQDANQKLPQIPSEQASVPAMPDLVIGRLTLAAFELPTLPARPELRSTSSPPVYLTQLRLLI